jgi:dTDP-4-dehydrorhamnose 3,5-epimerase
MRFQQLDLPGVVLIEPDVHRDGRGFFAETFHAAQFAAAGITAVFVQENLSASVRHTLRGLHFQWQKPQGKLVRVVAGEIWDVAVDLRPESATFGRWTGATLSREDLRQLYIPPGFAHGFCVLSERAEVQYKCTELYDPADEGGIAYDDPALAIPWPFTSPVLSDKDRRHGTLASVTARLRHLPGVVEDVTRIS